MIGLAELNGLSADEFVAAVGFAFERAPWVAQRAYPSRPFRSVDELHAAMVAVMERASEAERLALIGGHPDLGDRARIATASSHGEQQSAGLMELTPAEATQLLELNAAYRARFGFPFILCARENTKGSIVAALRERLEGERQAEIGTALREIAKIARLRLGDAVG